MAYDDRHTFRVRSAAVAVSPAAARQHPAVAAAEALPDPRLAAAGPRGGGGGGVEARRRHGEHQVLVGVGDVRLLRRRRRVVNVGQLARPHAAA